MNKGWIHLSVVPGRAEASDASEMVTQLLFGASFEILDEQKDWVKIQSDEDGYVCWIGDKQFTPLTSDFDGERFVVQSPSQLIGADGQMIWLNVGSILHLIESFEEEEEFDLFEQAVGMYFEEQFWRFQGDRRSLALDDLCRSFLNVPYLWGGKNLMGIDCSGFTQVVFRALGTNLLRDASQQETQGEEVAYEDAQKGDLAFFSNDAGKVIHVGIILDDYYIMHASGKVRVDLLKSEGIWWEKEEKMSHKLTSIKRVS